MAWAKEIQKKILLLGDGSVGKTSLIRRFVVDKFEDKYIATIGTKITAKDMQIEMEGDTVYLKLQIWDILGQKGYKKLYQSSFRGVDGVFMVADITRTETLEGLRDYWIPEVHNIVGPIPFVILANKSDLMNRAIFDEKELKEFASMYKVPFYLTSAKNGENVIKAFRVLGKRMIKRRVAEIPRPLQPKAIEDRKGELTKVIDMIIDDFCREYGNLQDAMPILRKQFEIAELDVNNPTRSAIIRVVDRLATYETTFRKKEIAEANHVKRLKWIKEAN
ncbi:MAG: GTP-binding protein [Thermoplasmata archaeon]|nr:MAG: GTP-binding protein [Thermoplasmata archaeon]